NASQLIEGASFCAMAGVGVSSGTVAGGGLKKAGSGGGWTIFEGRSSGLTFCASNAATRFRNSSRLDFNPETLDDATIETTSAAKAKRRRRKIRPSMVDQP